MCRIRETENLWSLCTATLPGASSVHTVRMALLVVFLKTMTLFILHKEFEMWGSPSVHNKVSYSEISKPFVNWNDLSLVSSCPLAMGVAGCSKFTYMATFCKKGCEGANFLQKVFNLKKSTQGMKKREPVLQAIHLLASLLKLPTSRGAAMKTIHLSLKIMLNICHCFGKWLTW